MRDGQTKLSPYDLSPKNSIPDANRIGSNRSTSTHIDRQLTRESSTDATFRWQDFRLSSDLTELGQEAIAAVSKGVADGAPLVKCQLLASTFYEALRHELRKAESNKRSTLLAVTDQCHRSAAVNISPLRAKSGLPTPLGKAELPPCSCEILTFNGGSLAPTQKGAPA
jgi:hypothetical protein